MGNHNSDLTQAQFKSQWRQVHQIEGLTVWENKKNPNQKVDQYIVREEQAENSQKLYQLRRDSMFLVKAYFLKKQGFSCQIDYDSKKIFVQRTPLRLSNLKDIPYPDIFHLYDVCIHGYQQLSKVVGYFSIDEDQIGINERGQAKVWLSNRFESNKINGVNVTESKMVGDMLNMLYQVADNDSCGKYHNIYWYIGNHEKITFAEAHAKFVEYVRTYCDGEVPTRLSCVNEVGPSNIEDWCRTHQSYEYGNENARITEQVYQNTVGRDEKISKIPETKYVEVAKQPLISQNNYQTFNPPNYTSSLPTIDTKVSEPNFNIVNFSGPQANTNPQPIITNINIPSYPFNQTPLNGNTQIITSFVRPSRSEKVVSGAPIQPNGYISFNVQPSTSPNLVQTTSGTQGPLKFIQTTPVINSRVVFTGKPNPVLPSAQVIQQQPPQTLIQRSLPSQNVQYVPQGYVPIRPQGLPEVANQQLPSIIQVKQPQSTILNNQRTIVSQPPVNSFNPPTQVMQQAVLNEQKDDSRLQQQRIIFQNIELKEEIKLVETKNTSVPTIQTNGYKTQEINSWQNYTSKQQTNTNDLNNYGRAIPYSFDVLGDKATQNVYESKFTPESDGKSSPEFLALLSQIKSGIGQKSTITQNYSTYSPSKLLGNYESYDESKYVSGDYVSSKYTGGLDPQLHTDLQKYKQ